MKDALITGGDGIDRCFWPEDKEDYLLYHDEEWGVPVDDDYRLFEKVCLEGFQAGLSWLTILRKRENFRKAFRDFDYRMVAKFSEKEVEKMLQNEGIIRHRGKIEASINNAQRAIELVDEFGTLGAYFWSWEPESHVGPIKFDDIQSTSEASTALSKDLKKRGWRFVGPTTVYAFMQAMGMVNDHFEGCGSREVITKARKKFVRPT